MKLTAIKGTYSVMMTSHEEWTHKKDSGEREYPNPVRFYYKEMLDEMVSQLYDKAHERKTVQQIFEESRPEIKTYREKRH